MAADQAAIAAAKRYELAEGRGYTVRVTVRVTPPMVLSKGSKATVEVDWERAKKNGPVHPLGWSGQFVISRECRADETKAIVDGSSTAHLVRRVPMQVPEAQERHR